MVSTVAVRSATLAHDLAGPRLHGVVSTCHETVLKSGRLLKAAGLPDLPFTCVPSPAQLHAERFLG